MCRIRRRQLKERMSDENDNGRPGNPGGRAPLTLKPRTGSVSAGVVKQSFSHGRSKTVVVETKRARPLGHGAAPNLAAPSSAERRPSAPAPSAPRPAGPSAPSSSSAGGLSAEEMRARQRVVDAAREAQERQASDRNAAEARAADDARRRAAEAAAA
ncbi:MAG: translation initiation factor, partial [Caulobacter sp.]|nr:translation initiation factor [Caulobacter sp.]